MPIGELLIAPEGAEGFNERNNDRAPEAYLALAVLFGALRDMGTERGEAITRHFFESGSYKAWVYVARMGWSEITEDQMYEAYTHLRDQGRHARALYMARAQQYGQ